MKKNNIILMLGVASAMFFSACNSDNKPKDSSIVETNMPEDISLDGLLPEYGLDSSIDLSDLSVIVKYSDNSTQKISLFDDGVTYDSFDTASEGIHTVTITYNGISTSVSYNVRAITLILNFNGGLYQDKESISVNVLKNKANISNIVPTPQKEGYRFAGWFYDKELTKRVDFKVKDELNVTSDTTLYAGYDIDYTKIFEYEVKNNEVILKSFIQNKYEWTDTIFIPKTIDLYPVTTIGDNFAYCENPYDETDDFVSYLNINNLIFEEGSQVRIIGKNAFNMVPLTNVDFPDTIEKIDEYAFYYTKMTNLVLPKKIKSLEAYSFAFNYNLENVDFNDSDLISIGTGAFSDCMKLNQITLSNKIEIIGSEAFKYCTNFKEFNIPSSVETIGINVFSGFPNLISINVDPNNKKFQSIDGNLYSKDGTIFYRYCYGNANKEFVMPSSVKIIFEGAFNIINENAYLERLVLNEGLEQIGDLSFENTTIDFTLPASLNNCGQKAFYGWNGNEFKINDQNPYYKVSNNSLVSKDGKKLYAIAGGYSENVYTLDDEIEEIASYVCKGLDVSAIIINASSKLEKIESKAFDLTQFKNLNYLYIKKNNPFLIEKNSFYADDFKYNEEFSIITLENIEAYKKAWDGNTIYDDVLINDKIITPEEYIDYQIEHLEDYMSLSSLSAFEEFNKLLVLNDNYHNNFYLMLKCLNKTISIIRLDTNISELELDYLKQFIIIICENSIDYFSNVLVSELTLSECDYQKFYDYYQMIPSSILTDLDSTYKEKAVSLEDDYKMVMNNVANIMADINNFQYSKTSFDIDKFNDIMMRVKLYGFDHIKRTNNQDLAYYRLEVQNLLYLFNTIDYNIENYSDLNKLYNGSYFIIDDYSLGLKFYFENVLIDENENQKLYGYDALEVNVLKLNKLEEDVKKAITEKFNSFVDDEIYHEGMYDELFKYYDMLEDKTLLDYDIVIKYNSYLLRTYYNDFIKNSTNPQTNELYKSEEYPDDILVKLNMIGTDMNYMSEYDSDYILGLKEFNLVVTSVGNYNDKYYEIVQKEEINDSFDYDSSVSYFEKYNEFIFSTGDDKYFNAIIIANKINRLNNIKIDENNYEDIFNQILGEIAPFISSNKYDDKVIDVINKLLDEGSYDYYLSLKNLL